MIEMVAAPHDTDQAPDRSEQREPALKSWKARAARRREERFQAKVAKTNEIGLRLTLRFNMLHTIGRSEEADAMLARHAQRTAGEERAARLARMPLPRYRRVLPARRTQRTTRTRRATTRRTTGDPDPEPEPSGDARARLRSVALIEAAPVGGGL